MLACLTNKVIAAANGLNVYKITISAQIKFNINQVAGQQTATIVSFPQNPNTYGVIILLLHLIKTDGRHKTATSQAHFCFLGIL
jgi:hypothetical protein